MRHTLITLLPLLLAAIAGMMATGCIEDGITTAPSSQPVFSTDTLRLGTVWTGSPTPTSRFTVYNRHDKILNLSRVAFSDDPEGHFRLNVDGTSGREITDIEIRPNDSILVFVEATIPETGMAQTVVTTRHIDFLVNGQTSSVTVTADARDIRRITSLTIVRDTLFTAEYPIQIADSLTVAAGATLTLEAGTRLLFHDKARMRVEGTLLSLGTPEKRVDMTGDRTGNVVSTIPYDIMSGQWGGVTFAEGSAGNRLDFTTIRNSTTGVCLDSLARIEMRGCTLRNAVGYPLSAYGASVTASGCEIAEGGAGVIYLRSGSHAFDHCTVANHYLFSIPGGAAIQLDGLKDDTSSPMEASFTNTIVYGLGDDLNHTDLSGTGVTFTRCLLRSAGADDDNFRSCLWDTDPLYLLDRSKYIFDYHLADKSPALGAAEGGSPGAVSPDGADISRHIGAYGPK